MSMTSADRPRTADATTRVRGAGAGPVDPLAGTVLRPLALDASVLVDGYLADLQARNGETSIRRGDEHLTRERAWDNFEHAAAGHVGEEYFGPNFEDGEVFKWLEAVAWEEGRAPAADLDEWLHRYSALAARAQADDGYLSTFNQASGVRGRYEWISYDHEIFNMATMIQAAIARYRATGSTQLLDVARRAADHLDRTFGWGKREELCGHPLIEMALVELYRVTEERRYLELASYFVDKRGHGVLFDPTWQNWSSTYFCDRVPVRETEYPEGHAVRAVYLAAGATDVAVETGDAPLLDALTDQWARMVDAKMYVNGSLGARWEGESFGDPYELPTDRGYGETCAAIASIQWSWRLLLATGEPQYADLIERQLYNAVLSGVSRDGDKYFYVNSLQVREGAVAYDERMPASGRHPWFGCSCCPTNIMRTLATLQHLVATESTAGVQIQQFASADISAGDIRLRMRTGYPWHGDVRIEVEAAPQGEWRLDVRVPAWAEGARATVGGEEVSVRAGEYLAITRTWAPGDVVELALPFGPRRVHGHPRVDAVRGAVAIERGPLVYALEQVDQPQEIRVDDVVLREGALHEVVHEEFGVPALRLPVRVGAVEGEAVAIPYFLWANRAIDSMRVWLPVDA